MGIYKGNKVVIHIKRQGKRTPVRLTKEECRAIYSITGMKLTVSSKKKFVCVVQELLAPVLETSNLTQSLRNIMLGRIITFYKEVEKEKEVPQYLEGDDKVTINFRKQRRTSVCMTKEEILALLCLYPGEKLSFAVEDILKHVTKTSNVTQTLRNNIFKKLSILCRDTQLKQERLEERRLLFKKNHNKFPLSIPLVDTIRYPNRQNEVKDILKNERKVRKMVTRAAKRLGLTDDDIPQPYNVLINKFLDAGLKPFYIRELFSLNANEFPKMLNLAKIQFLMPVTDENGTPFYACRGGYGKGLWDMRAGLPVGLQLGKRLGNKVETVCNARECPYSLSKLRSKAKNLFVCEAIRVRGRLNAQAPHLTREEKKLIVYFWEINKAFNILDVHNSTGFNINSIVKFLKSKAYQFHKCPDCKAINIDIVKEKNIKSKMEYILSKICKKCERKRSRVAAGISKGWNC